MQFDDVLSSSGSTAREPDAPCKSEKFGAAAVSCGVWAGACSHGAGTMAWLN